MEVCLLRSDFSLVIVLWECYLDFNEVPLLKVELSIVFSNRALGLRTLVKRLVGRGGIEPLKSFETGYEPVGFSIRHIYPYSETIG